MFTNMGGNIGHLLTMNLILRPLDNPNDPVWSVIFMVFLSVCMAVYVIIYILGVDEREEHGSHDTPKQEELLQLPSDGDQPCP